MKFKTLHFSETTGPFEPYFIDKLKKLLSLYGGLKVSPYIIHSADYIFLLTSEVILGYQY